MDADRQSTYAKYLAYLKITKFGAEDARACDHLSLSPICEIAWCGDTSSLVAEV